MLADVVMGQEEIYEEITRHPDKKGHMGPEKADPFYLDGLAQELDKRGENQNPRREALR